MSAGIESAQTVQCGAHFSADRHYRYALWRDWGGPMQGANMRSLVVIGLNPSTADESTDDPTIRRCIGFAKREGCARLVMLNLFAVRATDPKVMLRHPEPVGEKNDAMLRHWCRPTVDDAPLVVAAWGAHGSHRNRAAYVRGMLASLGVPVYCFGQTASGEARHPLYLKGDTPLVGYVR